LTQNRFTASIAAYKARYSYFLEFTWGGQDQFIKYSVRALYTTLEASAPNFLCNDRV